MSSALSSVRVHRSAFYKLSKLFWKPLKFKNQCLRTGAGKIFLKFKSCTSLLCFKTFNFSLFLLLSPKGVVRLFVRSSGTWLWSACPPSSLTAPLFQQYSIAYKFFYLPCCYKPPDLFSGPVCLPGEYQVFKTLLKCPVPTIKLF